MFPLIFTPKKQISTYNFNYIDTPYPMGGGRPSLSAGFNTLLTCFYGIWLVPVNVDTLSFMQNDKAGFSPQLCFDFHKTWPDDI